MAYIDIDLGSFPVVKVMYPPTISDTDIKNVFARYTEIARRGERLAWLIDFRHFNPVLAPATARQGAARAFHAHRNQLLPVTACEARVVTDSLSRGILTAFDWLTEAKWPCANFATCDDAMPWIRNHLAKGPRS